MSEDKDFIPAKDFLNELIEYACLQGASDIHIDPNHDTFCINIRSEGALKLYANKKINSHLELIGRIKILENLRTDVHEKGQYGRFEYFYVHSEDDENKARTTAIKERLDIRVSILPTFYGENAVLRILRPERQLKLCFEDIGMTKMQIEDLTNSLDAQKGIIIVAGPTGSGKTTTIYTMIKYIIEKGLHSIVTIEDPVEYIISGIRQIQVSDRSGFDFSKALRSILRQDPDIIVIGELRDSDTARLAFQAALTGHLVITSIHAEDSASVCARLRDLGVSNESLHNLATIISQRLVNTKNFIKGTENVQIKHEVFNIKAHSRIGIFEVLRMQGKFKLALLQKSFPEYIRLTLKNNGALLLKDQAESLVDSGYIDKDIINILPC